MNHFNSKPRRSRTPDRAAPGRNALRRFRLRPVAQAIALAMGVPLALTLPVSDARAQALPTGLAVVQGQASVASSGNRMTVTNSANALLNWQSFSVGAGKAVQFVQPNAASKVLNRVVGNDPSSILGSISSNGQVWLLNPNGVLFGRDARVDVAAMVASTLNISDADWATRRLNLLSSDIAGAAGASVVNQGEIRTTTGGHVMLLGGTGGVSNEGLIEAPGGQIVLAAGRSIELIDSGLPNLAVQIQAPAGQALNLGTLTAAGGRVDLSAAIVNQQGIVRANSLGGAAGQIVLSATSELNTSAGSVITANGASGGQIKLDSGAGTAMLGGRIEALGDGGGGGQVRLLGRQVALLDSAVVDASGRSGGGEVLLGGGQQGKDSSVPNSQAVYLSAGASISADALEQGNGGRVIVWSDDATRVYGSLSARGGSLSGNGGFIETSGGWLDARPASIRADAPHGSAGLWLLDPVDIVICNVSTCSSPLITEAVTDPGQVEFTAPAQNIPGDQEFSYVDQSTISSLLSSGTSVTIQTTDGSITSTGATITSASTGDVTLTLDANRTTPGSGNINIGAMSITSSSGKLNVVMNADGDINLTVPISSTGVSIQTLGGNVGLTAGGAISTNFTTINTSAATGIGGTIDLTATLGGITLTGSTFSSGGETISLGATGPISMTASTINTSLPSSTAGVGAILLISASDGITLSSGSNLISGGGSIYLGAIGAQGDIGIDSGSIIGTISPRGTTDAASDISIFSNAGSITIAGSIYSGGGNIGIKSTGSSGAIKISGPSATIDSVYKVVGPTGEPPPVTLGASGAVSITAKSVTVSDTSASSVPSMTITSLGDVTAGSQGSITVLTDSLTLTPGALISSGADITLAGYSATSISTSNMLTFNNSAGSGALSAPNGRWLAYATDPTITADFDTGGLVYDFRQYNAVYGTGTETPTPSTGNGFLFSLAPQLLGTVSQKFYDGTTTASGLVFFGGLIPGDTFNGDPTYTSLDFSSKNAYVGPTVSTQPVTVTGLGTIVDSTNPAVAVYGYRSSISGYIMPKQVTVSGQQVANKTYDGTMAATITGGVLSDVQTPGQPGLVGNETLTLISTGQFSSKDVGIRFVEFSTALGNGSNGGLASNYSLLNVFGSSQASITPATLTYAANPAVRALGDPLSGFTGAVTGFVGSETLATATTGSLDFSTLALADSPPGIYAIDGFGLTADNYVFVQAPGNAQALAITSGATYIWQVIQPDLHFMLPPASTKQRVLDALQALTFGLDGRFTFSPLDLGSLSQEQLGTILDARDSYMKSVYAEAISRLEADPTLADAPVCMTLDQVDSGSCLISEELKAKAKADRAGATLVADAAPVPAAQSAADAAAAAPASAKPAKPAANITLPAQRTVRTASLPQINRKIAVLIGNDHYADARIPQLDNAVGDATAIAKVLEEKLGYETLVIRDGTRETIIGTLNKLALEVGPKDSVVVYYAGHGELIDKTGQGYWQPVNADATRPETWISNNDIGKLLAQIGASQVALISDSCFSGSLLSDERIRKTAKGTDADSLLARRAVVAMSSGGNEPVADSGKNGHSPFAWTLMQSLDKVSAWSPGGNVFEQVRFAVARQLPQRPQYGAARLGGHEPGAEYVFESRQLEGAVQ